MNLRRPFAALSACCTLFAVAPASAQSSGAELIESPDRLPALASPRPRAPDFRMPDGDLRLAGEPQRSGLIASVPLNRGVEVGIGRFRVSEIARPRTYTETDRNPAAMGPRQRSIAGFGLSLRFE